MKPTIFIFAKDYKQYTEYLFTRKDISKYRYRYLDNLSIVFGIGCGDIIFIAGSEVRGDYGAVEAYCLGAGFEVEHK